MDPALKGGELTASSRIDPKDILVAAALADEEAAELAARGARVAVVGVGKVNAAARLAFEIARRRPALVLNVGTAGSARFDRGALVECVRFIQRDMDVSALGFPLGVTPFDAVAPDVIRREPTFGFLPLASCGTGDGFATAPQAAGFDGGDVVDMEAYALAKVCLIADMPFACLKYVTDGADGDAAEDWRANVKSAARAFAVAFDRAFA